MSDPTSPVAPAAGGDRRPVLRLVIADGQPLFARSLEMVLGPTSDGRIEVVGIATSVGEALGVVGQLSPDLVLVDLDLPMPGGVDLVTRLRERHPTVRVLALSKADDFDVAADALSAGAEAFVSKAARPEQLLAPLLAVLQGWKVLSAPMLEHLLARARRPGGDLLSSLDDDERALWRLVASGLEIAAIADQLYVSERTAKRMVADLRNRLGVRTRIEMAALAGRVGLLDDIPAGVLGSRTV
jgi:two-component system nitrate/nitrite response regulator NarL